MEVLYQHCCGVDVHKKLVVAHVITPEQRATRSFGTTTEALLEFTDWLVSLGVTHVAMESTGVYWKPLYNLLEGVEGMTILIANARHIKAVPGRKTDVKDAEWLADLLRHGLIRGSYIPDRSQRELRELTRYRTSIVRERVDAINRIQKILEGANIKLSSVASQVVGVSGLAMLKALANGEEDPKVLASFARGRMKQKQAELEGALSGLMGPHQRFMLTSQIHHFEFLTDEIEQLSQEIAERMRPFENALQRLDTIPGVGRRIAEHLVAEVGADVNRFPTAAHLASWARVCPGNNESAGKRLGGHTGYGNPWLRTTLVEAARAAARTRNTYLSAQYHRLAARRGSKRAAMAGAHTILTIVYHLLRDGDEYQDLGANYFDERDRTAAVRRSVNRLQRLGYKVTVEEAA